MYRLGGGSAKSGLENSTRIKSILYNAGDIDRYIMRSAKINQSTIITS